MDNHENFQTLPILEAYTAKYYERIKDDNGKYRIDDVSREFSYADGTSDSYVKRGFDEEKIQAITRTLGLEQAYRIYTTNTSIDFQPYDKVKIGDRTMNILKVLPLLNQIDNLRMYNYTGGLYRELAPKLIYLE